MGLHISYVYNKWPDVLSDSLLANCPSLPISRCTCWCLSWVALREEKCPEQMENLTFMEREEELHKHSPQRDCHFSVTTKEGTNSTVFRWFESCRFTLVVLDLLANCAAISSNWNAGLVVPCWDCCCADMLALTLPQEDLFKKVWESWILVNQDMDWLTELVWLLQLQYW